jgi:phosphatidylinositol alpha-mannosyltransferase
MKIAMSNAFLPTDEQAGVAFQVHYLANALVRRGHDVTVFSFSPRPADAAYAVHQYRPIPRLRKFYPFLLAWELARTDFSRFDVIHAHGDNFLMRLKHPQVRTFHGSARDEARAAQTLRRRLFFQVVNVLEHVGARVADRNVGVSEATRHRLPRVRSIIPCGVDTSAFCPGEKSPHPTILFVGTTMGRKRGRWLAEVFVRDVRSSIPDAELIMVSDEDVHLNGVRNMGRLPLERLTELYRSSWVFCLPSTYEGFGVPYIEAMASGTAVVATKNPGAREVLADGLYGELSDDDNLGTRLREVLLDSQRRQHLGDAGVRHAASYRWDAVALQYEAVYADAQHG